MTKTSLQISLSCLTTRLAMMLCLAFAGVSLGSSARAGVVTDQISFSFKDFSPGAPVDPVVGEITITFDPTLFYPDETTTGITLNSLNINLGSPISFFAQPGFLDIGGTSEGTRGLQGNRDDFLLTFCLSKCSTPQFQYSQADQQEIFNSINGIVTITEVVTSAPEPVTFSTFCAGLAGAIAMRRRKKA